MFPYLLPPLLAAFAWAVGAPLLRRASGRAASEAAALFVGLAAILAVLSWCSFGAGLGMRAAGLVLLPLALALLVWGRRDLRSVDWPEVGTIAIVMAVVYLHFLWPVIARPGADIALGFSGDFNQYIGVGTWLQDRSIQSPIDPGAGYNTLHANVVDHQGSRLRIGALMLLGLFALGANDVPEAFSAYTGLLVALQALGVFLLARRLAPEQPLWIAGLAGILFGVSPTATWAAHASFIPQLLGLGLASAAVTIFSEHLDAHLESPVSWTRTLRRSVPSGLLFFAAWCCYPEVVPLVGLVSLAYLFLRHGRRLAAPEGRRGALQFGACVLAVWVLASPVNFWWGVQGMLVQLGALPHGAEQDATPWTLFGMAVGAMEQPLFAGAGTFRGEWFQTVSVGVCLAAAAGIVALLLRGNRALPMAIVFGGAILFSFVMHRYSFARHGHLPDWHTLYTWNLFKAATFMAPLLVAAAVAGLATLGHRLAGRAGTRVAVLLMGGALLSLAVRQDVWGSGHLSYVSIPGELREFLRGIPPGRLLVDVHGAPREPDYNQRYAMYGVLGPRPFVSTRDWQPYHLYQPQNPIYRRGRDQFFREPFAYVLTDKRDAYPAGLAIGSNGPYTLLDVRGKDFLFTVHEWSHPMQRLVNLGAAPAARDVALDMFDLGRGRVSWDAGGKLESVPAQTIRTVAVIPVPPRGGLAHLLIDPAPTEKASIFVRAHGPEAPVTIDLMPQVRTGTISTDREGQRMTVEPAGGALRLAMATAGTSRAQVAAQLEPGEYMLHVETGAVQVLEKADAGFGSFLGPDNDPSRTMELQPDTDQFLRISVDKRKVLFFSLGFGGWGRARGVMELRKFEILQESKLD